jgi:hypothetical protein
MSFMSRLISARKSASARPTPAWPAAPTVFLFLVFVDGHGRLASDRFGRLSPRPGRALFALLGPPDAVDDLRRS